MESYARHCAVGRGENVQSLLEPSSVEFQVRVGMHVYGSVEWMEGYMYPQLLYVHAMQAVQACLKQSSRSRTTTPTCQSVTKLYSASHWEQASHLKSHAYGLKLLFLAPNAVLLKKAYECGVVFPMCSLYFTSFVPQRSDTSSFTILCFVHFGQVYYAGTSPLDFPFSNRDLMRSLEQRAYSAVCFQEDDVHSSVVTLNDQTPLIIPSYIVKYADVG